VTDLRQRLERLVPELRGEGEWERVLVDAGRSRTRRLSLVLPLGVAAAAVAVLALAWPFGSERSGGVLDRALAAIGEGPVLHIVYRGEWGPTLVDLSSGEVTPLVAEWEVWYDPKRGIQSRSKLGSSPQAERVIPRRHVSGRQEREILALAENYRTALQSGKARVVGRGRVAGRPVVWIRISSEWYPSSRDGHYHLHAQEIAIDRSTYEPVYARMTQDGRPLGDYGQAIIELERVSADAADFDVDPAKQQHGGMGGTEFGRLLAPGEFTDAVGGTAFWLGQAYAGSPLADSREFLVRRRAARKDEWETTKGLYLFYGDLSRRGGVPLRALSEPKVVLEEFREVPQFWISASNAAAAREGSILFSGGDSGLPRESGLLLRDGTHVSISAPTVREVLQAAVALRPVGADRPGPSGLDLGGIARSIESREGHRIEVSGGRPVRPRPIVTRRGKPVQSGSGDGVKVRIYRSGAAVFDTTDIRPGLRELLPEEVTVGCIRVTGPHGSIGGIGVPFRRRITVLLSDGRPGPRGRRPAGLPLDACEVGGGLGRNWLPRFDWHGPFEIPLTDRGRRFFEERAAARELADFVRTGKRRQARVEMKRGEPAPPAERLEDFRTPHIQVSSTGNRFTASLEASTGRRFSIEIVRGRIASTNADGFARVT
jgi:hypothetical protein